MNKKGIMDIIFIAGMLFALVIAALVVTKIYAELDEGIQESTLATSTRANDSWMQAKAVSENFDFVVLAAFVCLVLISLILAAVIPANPLFIPVYIILGLFVIIISVAISNAYQAIAENVEFTGIVAAHYAATNFIMNNLPLLLGILVVIMMIVTYAKPNR